MATTEYHIVGHWRVLATPEEAFDVLESTEDLPRWWPAAFTESLTIQSGDEIGESKVVRLESRGVLPYRLRCHVVASDVERPRSLVNKVWGDVEGLGAWTLTQDGDWTEIGYDWRVSMTTPLFGLLSPLIKPAFSANHRWALAKGEQSLSLEIERRRAANDVARSVVPAPPQAIGGSTWRLAFAAGALVALVMLKRR